MKLPTSEMNLFLNKQELVADDVYAVEMHVMGLIEPEKVTAVLHECREQPSGNCCVEKPCSCSWDCVMLTGKAFFAEENAVVSTYRVGEFEKHLKVPFNAVDPIPQITITLARDNCGNITEGIIRIEWKVGTSSIPIEIKECK